MWINSRTDLQVSTFWKYCFYFEKLFVVRQCLSLYWNGCKSIEMFNGSLIFNITSSSSTGWTKLLLFWRTAPEIFKNKIKKSETLVQECQPRRSPDGRQRAQRGPEHSWGREAPPPLLPPHSALPPLHSHLRLPTLVLFSLAALLLLLLFSLCRPPHFPLASKRAGARVDTEDGAFERER